MFNVGVDVSKGKWLAVKIWDDSNWEVALFDKFQQLWSQFKKAKQILVDIPIGLLESGQEERVCDLEARKVLKLRQSSVFPVPCRPALRSGTWDEASSVNYRCTGRKLSQQSYAISPKIKEVDDFLKENLPARLNIAEVHPELLFWSLNNSDPMKFNKKTESGFQERKIVLAKYYPNANEVISFALNQTGWRIGKDDIFDALVAAEVAFINDGNLKAVPETPPVDSSGLPMRMLIRA